MPASTQKHDRKLINRINQSTGKSATGPRGAAGKASSAMNALRHGAYSQAILVLGEHQEALDQLRKDMVTSLGPVGPLELLLVNRLTALWWRLERAQRVERETLEVCLAQARFRASDILEGIADNDRFALPRPRPEAEDPTQTAFHWDDGMRLERLLRYEGQLERSFFRLLHELERLQLHRGGQPVPPPLVADVQISVEAPEFVLAKSLCESLPLD